MKLTKYEHACVVLEDKTDRIIIDPGKFTSSLANFSNVRAVVVTHIHGDHFDLEKLEQIARNNQDVQFFGPEQVALEASSVNMKTVKAGKVHEIGDFQLAFYGGDHELYKGFQNIAVLVNEIFFHPGDSYTKPNKPIKVLGLPASGPWLRVPDTVNYLKSCRPEIAIPIHNALLSEIGESIHYRIIGEAAKELGIIWKLLEPNEAIEL